MISMALAALTLTAADIRAVAGIDPDMCRVVRIAASGARTETAPTIPYRTPSGLSSHASSRQSGAGGASVSVSSSSSAAAGSGESTVTIDGRRVTTTYDNAGCTVIIDERGAQGAQP